MHSQITLQGVDMYVQPSPHAHLAAATNEIPSLPVEQKVTDSLKKEKRTRNNEASRRSRAKKKQKFNILLQSASELRKENDYLSNFINELELMVNETKAALKNRC